jgi:ABC-type proline/glycine betaine transport system permease subunit
MDGDAGIAWHTALPYVFAGPKVALPRAISDAVVGEFIAADRGLGYYINNARVMADTVGLFTGVAVVTLLAAGDRCRARAGPGALTGLAPARPRSRCVTHSSGG